MNERLKELVKRAGGHISIRNLASNPVQHIESVELWDDRIEKFAELLVKECSYLADQAHHKATGGKTAGGYIRQHFGVEE